MKIVCLGDSCTYGQNVRADQAWPAVLARLTGHDVRNEGVCGDTTRLGLERWKYAVGLHSPDVVVLQFGHNDANEWDGKVRVPLAEYRANLEQMRKLVGHDARTIVLAPHKSEKGDDEYNRRLQEYAAVSHGLIPHEISILEDGYGVHPDEAMHETTAKMVRAWL